MAKSAAAAATTSKMKKIGENIEYSIEGDKLTMVVDLSADGKPSNSGKTIILASSKGNANVGDVKVGLNVYRYADKKK
jgi:hypothetical protein